MSDLTDDPFALPDGWTPPVPAPQGLAGVPAADLRETIRPYPTRDEYNLLAAEAFPAGTLFGSIAQAKSYLLASGINPDHREGMERGCEWLRARLEANE